MNKKTPPPVVSIISKKNSGKTTFLVKLIPELKKKGYTVGTLKHDVHGFDIDHEGKDTWKHKQAGSDVVVISCPWKVSLIKDVAKELSIDELVENFFMDADIVITEGYKRADKPKIELFRKGAHADPIYTGGEESSLIAMISDIEVDIDVPLFHIDDITGVADFIIDTFITGKPCGTK
ncbi:molybdopterin guanine dinucleotide biosynthesis accessory protein MobB [Desulfocicer vacuolatum DSM 3385]|uniref:Molybdopterin guanine dinucleotide biosynthesis accessory protein MobB n=1 Tax=Desulfocicer vacuolatum DSM 3385 TaxID=1121400 RepID=A0A1W1ZWP4_9BACT|nr:molybdopterin-guanine dinucleotide biosynthesis protein B [Desulfocicer vacuolatum]SMC52824.1 molybdopterin guanine dinucleotide biosynthesis accessory protein MobB [Desulfocicer vacuolatum DSM 3385]